MIEPQKDYSSISPSAKSLLLMKGLTNIPYAQQTAALMQGPEVFDLDFEQKDFWFWIRVMHFELRYWSIDQLLRRADAQNILELSSGYSFRGLELCRNNSSIHYVDTDLPEIVATKQRLLEQILPPAMQPRNFELRALNALDEEAFTNVASQYASGPLSIVNEGLLMYLNLEEKRRLCRNIHAALSERGGCWITADVYIKMPEHIRFTLPQSKSERRFFDEHNIEENKFDSYEQARHFFEEEGFEFVEESVPDYASVSIRSQLMEAMPEPMRDSKEKPPKIQATWMLRTK